MLFPIMAHCLLENTVYAFLFHGSFGLSALDFWHQSSSHTASFACFVTTTPIPVLLAIGSEQPKYFNTTIPAAKAEMQLHIPCTWSRHGLLWTIIMRNKLYVTRMTRIIWKHAVVAQYNVLPYCASLHISVWLIEVTCTCMNMFNNYMCIYTCV